MHLINKAGQKENATLRTPKETIWEEKDKIYRNKKLNLIEGIFFYFFLFIKFIILPFKNLKIGVLYSDKIGRFAGNTEFFLRKKYLDKNRSKNFYILISCNSVNSQLLKMISRKNFVIKSEKLNKIMHIVKQKKYFNPIWEDLNMTGWLRGKSWSEVGPQLKFDNHEIEKGKKILKSLGLKEDSKYVCFFAKDRLYSDNPKIPPDPNSFWGKKDFRNCDILNYNLAAEYLAKKNIYVIRVGMHKPENIWKIDNKMVIDYTGDFRHKLSDPEFADIFLQANAKFLVGCTAGIYLFSSIFNVPVASTNLVPYHECGRNKDDIIICKKLVEKKTNKIVPLEKCVELGIVGDWLTEDFLISLEKKGFFFAENNPNEIKDLVEEINERIDNKWVLKIEEKDLQNRYREVVKLQCFDGTPFPGRVGHKFLKKNNELLV